MAEPTPPREPLDLESILPPPPTNGHEAATLARKLGALRRAYRELQRAHVQLQREYTIHFLRRAAAQAEQPPGSPASRAP